MSTPVAAIPLVPSTPQLEPPFDAKHSLVDTIDLVLPRTYAYMGMVGRCDETNAQSVQDFLEKTLDLQRINRLQQYLWLAAIPGPARPLHEQRMHRREIVLVERHDLHLLWRNSRLYVKPLPDFLLSYEFWQKHLCAPPSSSSPNTSREAACGLLWSYVWLIRTEYDLKIAQESSLINDKITFQDWTIFAGIVWDFFQQETNRRTINQRFHYGTIRLGRLDAVCRFTLVNGLSGFLQGYGFSDEWTPFMEQYNNAIAAFGLLVILLTALQVGLGTVRLQTHTWFQNLAFGLTALALILPIVTFAVPLLLAGMLFFLNLYYLRVYVLRRRIKAMKPQVP